MDYRGLRKTINQYLNSIQSNREFLMTHVGINVTRSGHFKVRSEEKTPSCVINKDGSFHDYGSGKHYGDMVALLYDGYSAFDSLSNTIKWLCQELGIDWEVYHG